jgi:hypothetical protein
VTLSTNLYVLDPVDARELFHFAQGLLTKYDDRPEPQTPDRQEWSDEKQNSAWSNPGSWCIRNHIGQGLPAILDVTYRPDGPLTTEEASQTCTEDCDPDSVESGPGGYHYHPHACWADLDFDTAYSYRDSRGWGCGDLHAVLVGEIGNWLDRRGIRWEWRNEFTGEVHGGDARYKRLIELASGGFEASAWFRTSVLPAIQAGLGGAS